MNILPLLRTDFIDVCRAIIDGGLDRMDIVFEKKATVCKYVVRRATASPKTPRRFHISRIEIGDAHGARSTIHRSTSAGRALHDFPGDRRGRNRDGLDEAERSPKGPSAHPGSVDHRRHRTTAHPEAVQHMKMLKAEPIQTGGQCCGMTSSGY